MKSVRSIIMMHLVKNLIKGSQRGNGEDLTDEEKYGSTGTWTLLIPIKKLDVFKSMKPNNNLFPTILKEMPRTSLHSFCFETFDLDADLHARHFSSPYSGTVEDAVTGTASGVIGAYFNRCLCLRRHCCGGPVFLMY